MIDITEIQKIDPECNPFGWLTPDGKIIACPMLNHLNVLKNFGFREQVEAIELADKKAREDVKRFKKQFGPGEHIEWHVFNSASEELADNLRTNFYQTLYANQWLRFGVYVATYSRHQVTGKDCDIEFEGSKSTLESRKDMISYIAEVLDYHLQTYENDLDGD